MSDRPATLLRTARVVAVIAAIAIVTWLVLRAQRGANVPPSDPEPVPAAPAWTIVEEPVFLWSSKSGPPVPAPALLPSTKFLTPDLAPRIVPAPQKP